MPLYAGKTIENIKPTEAGKRGYLLPEDVRACQAWVEEMPQIRQIKTLVYVNGVYKGTSTAATPLFQIVEKFKIAQ